MQLLFKKTFKKQYRTLQPGVKRACDERISLFTKSPFHPLLNNHPLSGKWKGCRSINITGDYRTIYQEEDIGVVRFLVIGTHSELYE